MKYFFVFFVFAMGYITIGEAIRCQQCSNIGEDCSGDSVECKYEKDFCTSAIEENIVNGDKIISVSRGCSNFTALCAGLITLTTTNFLLKIYNECCDKDDCNSGKIKMPEQNIAENKVKCNSCYVEGAYECNSGYEPIACTGNEGDCLEFSGDGTRPGKLEEKYYFAGCATIGACDIGYNALVGTMVGTLRNLSCPENLRLEG
ncbi:phospholipase A2 inhibitor and Ly6/PLAUR domain-containing protein-like [Rhinoderma darwinii]|uniref:phospholipase A2 inhibitor and Ly6/PLAUR domain-containing protein-like n=1 Tax=Rhinoderma darwinii TaxID=43563 RepID=UPI003F66738A